MLLAGFVVDLYSFLDLAESVGNKQLQSSDGCGNLDIVRFLGEARANKDLPITDDCGAGQHHYIGQQCLAMLT
jgi:hypothetical protein